MISIYLTSGGSYDVEKYTIQESLKLVRASKKDKLYTFPLYNIALIIEDEKTAEYKGLK